MREPKAPSYALSMVLKIKSNRCGGFLALCLVAFALGGPDRVLSQRGGAFPYRLTIYVDEGHGELNGHVFFGLSDGQTTVFRGWHCWTKTAACLVGLNGGEVRDDSSLADDGWNVKRTYNITQAGYDQALRAMNNWESEGRPWAINHHCGDFAETITQAAGVPILLPPQLSGRNRPGLFGEYIRQHGGVAREANGDSSEASNDVFDDDAEDMFGYMTQGEHYFDKRPGDWERFKQRYPNYKDLMWSALEASEHAKIKRQRMTEFHTNCAIAESSRKYKLKSATESFNEQISSCNSIRDADMRGSCLKSARQSHDATLKGINESFKQANEANYCGRDDAALQMLNRDYP